MSAETSKILVVSDTHGRVTRVRWLLRHETADALFFLGDGLYDLEQALTQERLQPPYPMYRVRGNCDIGYPDPAEGLAPFGGVLFFYTHGHLYNAKSSYEPLLEAGAARGAEVALSGHTHHQARVPAKPGAPALFNPGSLRDTGSYGVITVEDGACAFGWKRVPQDL